MKKLTIILTIAFLPLIGWGQKTPGYDFLYDGDIVVVGSDTTLEGNTDYILTYIDFNITLGYLPLSSRAKLNGQPLRTYFQNANFADTSFALIAEQTLNTDFAELLPKRILEIWHYSTPTPDANNYAEIPFTLTASMRIVPTEYATIQLAVNAAGTNDTIIVLDGDYATFNFAKSLYIKGVGNCLVGTDNSIVYTSTTTLINYEISGFTFMNASASNYAFRVYSANDASTGVLSNNYFYNHLNFLISDNFDFHVKESTLGGLCRYSTIIGNNRFTDVLFTEGLGNYAQIQVQGSTYIYADRCYFDYNYKQTSKYSILLTAASDPDITLNRCTNVGYLALSNVSIAGGSLNIKNHTRIDTSTVTTFIDVDYLNTLIDSSVIDSGQIDYSNAQLEITNSTIYDSPISVSFTTTPDTFLFNNNMYASNDSSFFDISNTIPLITNNTFTHTAAFSFGLYNTVANLSDVSFSNNDCNYNYSAHFGEYIYIPTTTILPFNLVNITGNNFKLSRYYGSEIDHHLYLNFNSNSIFSYNEVSGAIIGCVVKDATDIGVTNKIFGNKFYECATPIYLRSMPNSEIYNNTSYNSTYNLQRFVFLDDNDGGANSDSCTFTNNIINTSTGQYYYFESASDTIGFVSTNNVLYNSDSIYVAGSYLNYTTWTGLGYDENSFNTNPNLKSSTELWPVSPSDAIGNADNTLLSTRLSISSAWPDNITLVNDNSTIGAYTFETIITRGNIVRSVGRNISSGGMIIKF